MSQHKETCAQIKSKNLAAYQESQNQQEKEKELASGAHLILQTSQKGHLLAEIVYG